MPTPFSLLCVILMTHFHQNACFRPDQWRNQPKSLGGGKKIWEGPKCLISGEYSNTILSRKMPLKTQNDYIF